MMSEILGNIAQQMSPSTSTTQPLMTSPSTDAKNQPQSKWPVGMLEPPNINLYDRPTVHNPDGTISSVRSMSFEEDGHSIVVPTVSDDGRILSEKEAIDQYHRTGRHLGRFATTGLFPWQFSDAYSQQLHDEYAKGEYGGQRSGQSIVPQTTPWNLTIPAGKK
jgi:hypothetical protein